MNKKDSEKISALIAQVIVESTPCIEYTDEDIAKAEASMSEEEKAALRSEGMLGDDFEHYYVVRKFCDMLCLNAVADKEYIKRLFLESRRLSAKAFYHDPYINEISVPDIKIGDFLLLNSFYDKGEFFQYDMPNLESDIVVPKLGFFDAPVSFPSIYEGDMPWMSVCPSEINSMREQMQAAHGRVLVLGLGLGYYPFIVSKKENVESVVIIERQPEIIRIFEDHILPSFSHREKITVIESDAYEYLEDLSDGEFDFCFADIWEGQTDGAPAYLRIKEYADAMHNTEFTYWIEKEIKWYIEREYKK